MGSRQKAARQKAARQQQHGFPLLLSFIAPGVVLLAVARTIGTATHSSETFYFATMVISVVSLATVRIMRLRARHAKKAAETALPAEAGKRSPKQKSAKAAASRGAAGEWTPERMRVWRVFVAGLPCTTIAMIHYGLLFLGF